MHSFLSFEPGSAKKKILAYTIIPKCDCDCHITHAFKREAIQNSHSIIFMDLNTIEYTTDIWTLLILYD